MATSVREAAPVAAPSALSHLSARLPTSLRAMRHRNFRIWAGGNLVSVTGTWMQVVAQAWLVLQLSGSPLALGLSVAMSALPAVLLGVPAGAVVDRVADKRRLLVLTQAAHCGLAVLLAALAATHSVQVWHVYAIALGTGLVGVLDGPGLGAFGQEIVGRDDLPNAIALGSLVNSTGRVVGMSLAGGVIALGGPQAVFALNAASFLAVLLALARIRVGELHPLARPTAEQAGVRAGLRYVVAQPDLLLVFALAWVLSTFGRNFQLTMAAMTDGPLHAGAAAYGVCSTVFAAGAFVGAFAAARMQSMTLRVLFSAASITSALQLVSAASPSVAPFAALMLPVAVGAVLIDTAVGSHVALATAEHMRGRVLAVQGVVSATAGAAGAPVLGWLAGTGGPRTALVVGGGVAGLATVVAGVLMLARTRRRQPARPVRLLVLGRLDAVVPAVPGRTAA